MPTYPGTVDSFTVVDGTTLLSTGHADLHNQVGSAVIAVEQKIGVGAGTPTADKALIGSGNGTSTWGTTLNNFGIGSPTITGGTVNSAVFGTPTVTGGTFTNPLISGGTGNDMVLGTPTIGTITVPGTVSPLTPSAALSPANGSITDSAGGTLTINAQTGQVFYSVMGTAAGNRTVGTPLNPTAWQSLTYGWKASGSANGTLIYPTGAFTYSQDTGTPALGTSTSWTYHAWRYNPVESKWHFMGQSKNVI